MVGLDDLKRSFPTCDSIEVSSIQVLVNLQGSRGTSPSRNHRAALQKPLCEAWLVANIPSIPRVYQDGMLGVKLVGFMFVRGALVSSSRCPCSLAGLSCIPRWEPRPEQEHARLRAALFRAADRKCALRCALVLSL